jgi:hypothetical protein
MLGASDIRSHTVEDGSTPDELHSTAFASPLGFLRTRADPELFGKRWFQGFESHIGFLERENVVIFLEAPPVHPSGPA